MPRRASSGISSGLLIGIAVAAAALFFGGKILLSGKSAESLSGSTLEMGTVTENANSLRGNEYVVEGTVDEKLKWTADRGQVVSLKVGNADNPEFLGIEIPAELSDVNIEREKRYAFKVRFREGGIAVARQITRL